MAPSRRTKALAVATLLLAIGGGWTVAAATLDPDGSPGPLTSAGVHPSPSGTLQVHRNFPLLIRKKVLLGHSVRRRPIMASEVGARSGAPSLLVVGCIHGNEPAGIAVARDLLADPLPSKVTLWVLPDLNPDGVAAGTRQNGRGVDLNRNFPFRWRPIGLRWDTFFSGPHPLSEPESRIARGLILQVKPKVTIWFHQSANLVDESGGSIRIERRYARLTHMRLARLPRYPGSAAGWQNHRLPATTAFVVELPAGSLTNRGVERFSDAVLRLLR